ncbi:hypothetical protein TL18_04365 [Methanobrevibacter sp. YE315]|uniref:DUF4013 domain-containing protein n=1 Tax=Methanobrevibacter sp. YE315 TaxID=1609968 RepID=UPI000764E5B4|nr:DUF4013 domain-containing protein [Methanobrevibacter sp. YE315]AMD17324.1 hypothetical protein TL18_04365 [Methanobrevibacter sp. YE315]
MSVIEVISDAIAYPFSDIKKYLIVGVLTLLAGFYSVLGSFGIDNSILMLLAILVSIVFALILSGYGLQVIKKGIQHSNEIPDIDPVTNLVDGIKVLIIGIVYYIIPVIIAMILGVFSGLVGAGLNHTGVGIGVGTILAIIVVIIFSILEIVAIAKFADTGNMGDAFSFGQIFEDAKRIGILNIILFVIIALIIILILSFILGLLAIIPYIGFIIGMILLGGFIVLFYNKGIGLLYASA